MHIAESKSLVSGANSLNFVEKFEIDEDQKRKLVLQIFEIIQKFQGVLEESWRTIFQNHCDGLVQQFEEHQWSAYNNYGMCLQKYEKMIISAWTHQSAAADRSNSARKVWWFVCDGIWRGELENKQLIYW